MATNVSKFSSPAPVQAPTPSPVFSSATPAPAAPTAKASSFSFSMPSFASVKDTSAQVFSKVKTSFEGKSGVILAFVVILLAFVFVIIFILREMKGNSYKKGKLLTDDLVKLSQIDRPVEVPGTTIPAKQLGNQLSYSFWLYVNNFVQTPDVHKIVFYRGEKDSIQTANPIVMLDGTANKLYFVIKTRDSSLVSTDPTVSYNTLKPIIDKNYFTNPSARWADNGINKHLVLAVNNVPFSRWVHFAIAINENVVTLYQDGEVYAVKTVDDFIQSREQEFDIRGDPIKYGLMIDDSNGSVYIGNNAAIANKTSVDGFLSKLQAFSYALNSEDIKNVYKEGPFTPSILKMLGISGYGLRNPVFKLKADASK